MKIKSISTYKLEWIYPQPIYDARSEISRKQAFFVKIVSDNDMVGWGEVACYGAIANSLEALINEKFIPFLLGQDISPRHISALLVNNTAHYGQKGLVTSIISGVELALWDILGKSFKCSITTLFGACHKDVDLYAATGYYIHDTPEVNRLYLKDSIKAIDISKFKGIKIKIGKFDIKDDLERVKIARNVIGNNVLLIVDANNSYSPREAILASNLFSDYKIYFMEEPIEFGYPDQSLFLKENSMSPIAGYEMEFGYKSFEPYIKKCALDIVQPDVTWTGGLIECMRIAQLAKDNLINVIPHNFSTSLSHYINYQFICISDTMPFLECDQTGNPLINLNSPYLVNSGNAFKKRYGIGFEIDEEILEPFIKN